VIIYGCDPCRTVDCVNGTCKDGECECNAGWTGDDCSIDMCAGVNCIHGTCVNGICQCSGPWTGTYCDQCTLTCSGHGDCTSSGTCDCDNGWEGDSCQTPVNTTLCTNTCSDASDGWCDDGGPGSDYAICNCGTDCADCGSRTTSECSEEVDGYLGVWTALTTFPCATAEIDVYVNDDYIGTIDSYFSTEPDCGDDGVVTVGLSEGTHTLYAECNEGTTYWGPGTIEIEDNTCTLIELTYSPKKNFVEVMKPLKKKSDR